MAIVTGFACAVALCLRALSAQEVAAFTQGEMRVVVDAGHGGVDVGVQGNQTGVKESDLNLSIALELKEVLEDSGFEVTLTRKTDGGLYGTTAKGFKKRDMQKRKELIEKAAPSMIISVHQNFYPAKGVRGAQVFYSKQSKESERLATTVQAGLNALYAEEGARARKAAQGEYFMLDCYPCPSVIVECGFLSNAADEALLQKSAWQRRLAERIAAGALAYFSENAL